MRFSHPPKHLWSCLIFLAGLMVGCLLQPSAKIMDSPGDEVAKTSALEIQADADPCLVAALYNSQAKARVLLRLVDAEMTLRETAEYFRVLDETNPYFN